MEDEHTRGTVMAIELAAAAAEAADIREAWREAAFITVLRSRLGDGGTTSQGTSVGEADSPAEDDPIAVLAGRLRVEPVELQDVVSMGPDGPEVIVPTARLTQTTMAAAGELAVLIAAIRQGLGVDQDWTPVAVVRDLCARYGKYDRGNFARHMKATGDAFSTRGTGPKLELRLTRPGWELAAEMVRRISG